MDFLDFCVGHCFWIIVKGAADVDDCHPVVFLYNDIWSECGIGFGDSPISRDRPESDCVGKAIDNFFMALTDCDHVGVAVVEDVG